MSLEHATAPDKTTAPNDPGDETANRFRFQWAWAAIVCCSLFDETEDVVEVFCEHHEDVLLKHKDGKFTGHQIKTRAADQAPWKADEEQVKNAIKRFFILEKDHPGYFRCFSFLTNHPLYVASSAKSLKYILSEINAATTIDDLPSAVSKWLRKIAETAQTSDDIAFQALKKTNATDELPKLADCLMRVISTLTQCWAEAKECTHQVVQKAASALVDECGRASALDHLQTLPGYLVASTSTTEAIQARISGKRMTIDRVREILSAGMNSTASLIGNAASLVVPGTGSPQLLLKKLDAGGFSAVSRNSAEDLRNKADYLGIVWTQKYGKESGLGQYDHVRSLALSDAATAFESTKAIDHKFGTSMLEFLRRRFKERRANGDRLFDCSDEHLEGLAYSLTAQCLVQWSIDRPWEEA